MLITGADRYSPEKLAQLEAHVDEQVAEGSFNLDANLALLRLYQFSPGTSKVPVVIKVLVKALMQLPGPAYRSCVQLLSDRLQNDESVYRIVQLAAALETARYPDFWAQTANARDLLQLVPGFYEASRTYIAHVLCLTFARVTKPTLATCLQLQGDSLNNWVKERCVSSGWSEVKAPGGDLVVLPRSDANRFVIKRTQEIIRFDQAAPVLRAVTVGFSTQ